MLAFARFILRDNGLAIHIAANQVTQVRETSEGDPAIYLVGKDTPLMVEGDVESALRRLQAAAAGVAPAEPELVPEPEPVDMAAAKPAKARKPKAAKAKPAAAAAPARIAADEETGDSTWFIGAR
jgi:hypothetical protein